MADDSDTTTGDYGHDSDSEDDDVNYGDVHRMVLQAFMAHGLMGPAAVKGLFKEAWKRCSTPPRNSPAEEMNLIAQTVKAINSKVSRFNFIIKTATCEFTGKMSYMFMVTVDSQLMRLQTYFSKSEVELFKKGLEKMMTDSEDFTIGSANFVNLALTMEGKVSIVQAEKVMEKMLDYNYFVKNFMDDEMDDYTLTLGIRSILELEPVISEDYPDALVHCQLCRKIMLHGYGCPKCLYILHIYCYKKYVKNSKECPNCAHDWILEGMMLRRRNENGIAKKDREMVEPEDLNVTPDPNTAEEDIDTQPTPRISAANRKRHVSAGSGSSTDELDN